MRQGGVWNIVEHLDDGLPGVVGAIFIIGKYLQFAGSDVDGIALGNQRQALPHASLRVGLAQMHLHIAHSRGDGAHAIMLGLGVDDYPVCCLVAG